MTPAVVRVNDNGLPEMRNYGMTLTTLTGMIDSEYDRDSIVSITFLDSLSDAPRDAWDVSAAGDGGVLAWVKSNGQLYDFYIAGEEGVAAPRYCNYMFARYHNMEYIDLSCFDTSNVSDMSNMFEFCRNLTEIIVSDRFVISEGTNTKHMFSGCGTDQLTVIAR